MATTVYFEEAIRDQGGKGLGARLEAYVTSQFCTRGLVLDVRRKGHASRIDDGVGMG